MRFIILLSIVSFLSGCVRAEDDHVVADKKVRYLAVDLIACIYANKGQLPADWGGFLSWCELNDKKGKWEKSFLVDLGELKWSLDATRTDSKTRLIVINAGDYKKYENWMNLYMWQYLGNMKKTGSQSP